MARTISIPEAARIIGVGVAAARAGAAAGEIPSIKCGRERRVPTNALDALLRGPVRLDAEQLTRDIRVAELRSRLAEHDAARAELVRQLNELVGEPERRERAA